MDINVHRAILYLALDKVRKETNQINLLDDHFAAIWLGNWITDMNQASCFLSFTDPKADYYTAFIGEGVDYDIPDSIKKIETEWVNMYQAIWESEIDACKSKINILKSTKPYKFKDLINLEHIGTYYPYDHFDVMTTESRKERQEFEEATNSFTKTAHEALYEHACDRLLAKAFIERGTPESLFYLGRATHVLADFFAHTNYIEMLINIAIDDQVTVKYPTIKSYFADPKNQVYRTDFGEIVMSGRFDQIDTAASILKIYKRSLVPELDDFDYTSVDDKVESTENDLFLEIIFGTFSNYPLINQIHKLSEAVSTISDSISKIKQAVIKGLFVFFKKVIQVVTDDEKDEIVEGLFNTTEQLVIDKDLVNKYKKAGQIQCLELEIAKILHEEISKKKIKLPHHTLIAKDSDNPHPVKRLEYKLACCLAYEVTRHVLAVYYSKNGSFEEAKRLIQQSYCHPHAFYLKNKAYVIDSLSEMYGVHWHEEIVSLHLNLS